jgi:hypothetical protein
VEDSQLDMMDVPRISPKTGIQITKTLNPGVVYVAKLGESSLPELVGIQSELLVKIIYSGLAKERYGQQVHELLSKKDMAPLYFTNFFTKLNTLPMAKLETYHVMEYLPPPSGTSLGWMTLHELGKKFSQEATRSKGQIRDALEAIINVLQLEKLVHGDLRTNNVLVCVQIIEGGSSVVIQPRPSNSHPPGSKSVAYLKVVDFDWAGHGSGVLYPSIRNPAIPWPGENGKAIGLEDDRTMINHWMAFWPNDPQPVQVLADLGYGQ